MPAQIFSKWRSLIFGQVLGFLASLRRELKKAIPKLGNALVRDDQEFLAQKTLQDLGLWKEVFDRLPDLIWFKNPAGVYLAVNHRCEEFLGASERSICHRTDFDFLAAEVAQANRDRDLQALQKDEPSVIEEWVTFATDGHRELLEMTMIPVWSKSDRPVGLLGIGRNLTERQQSEEKLQLSEERFALAMRGANDGLWDWNLETDEVYYSPRWKSMLGYENGELQNTLDTWKNLVHGADKERVLTLVQEYLSGNAPSFDVEMRMKHKAGHDVYVLSRAFLLHREQDEQPIRLVGTHVDITARKHAEAFDEKNAEILEMIATGQPASEIYREIALLYEGRHPGLRCSMLELKDGRLLHGGAPSLPKEYCEAVHGLKNGPSVGSCGTSTYTGKRVVVEDIATDPKWAKIKHVALPHGMRCCWSEPIKNSSGLVLGAFGMYYNHPALPNEYESNDLKSAARLAGIVMERDHAQKRIRELAYTDVLTGLASRASFYQHLESSILRCERNQSRFALLYIDLDDFKSVNDSLGHDVGDILLNEIAQRLRRVTRADDCVARLSGDEFCILVNDLDDNAAIHVAEKCLEMIARPIELSARKFTPACSIGIACYPADGRDFATLVKAADTSLYAAKERGKNQYVFYQPEFTERAEYRFRVEQSLREAVENQQLSLMYQPQVQMSTGKIVGVEALARWTHPKLGSVSPAEFIPTAERIGMIKPLTEWALRTACKQAVDWKNAGLPAIRMAVNISPVHFLDPDFPNFIRKVLEETGMVPSELELEITESVVQTDEQNLTIFQELRDLGVLLAIDDFGTGYSSFASLKHIKVDSLKIDKYFIDDMLSDPKSKLLVNSMIEMGRNLAQGIVAEGVETPEQCQLLRQLGCETSQGFLFSKPIPSEEVAQLLQDSVALTEAKNSHLISV